MKKNDENYVYGPDLTSKYPLSHIIIETTDFNDFLKAAFEENIEILYSKSKIFLVNIENYDTRVYLQNNLIGQYERIVGSRKTEKNELAFVFQNIRSLSKNLVMNYFSEE